MKIFINGISVVNSNFTNPSVARYVVIGENSQRNYWAFNEYISEFRISNLVKYTDNFTPLNESYKLYSENPNSELSLLKVSMSKVF